MSLEKSPIFCRIPNQALALSLLLSLGLASATVADPGKARELALDAPVKDSAATSEERVHEALVQAVAKARELKPGSSTLALEKTVEPLLINLARYPEMGRVHGHEEPLWLVDRGDSTAQAVLLLSLLEKKSPSPERRVLLTKLAKGLAALQRKNRAEYPFGAHISWRDEGPFAKLGDGSRVPTAYFRTDQAYAVSALALAGHTLSDQELVESAKREALGMSVHLLVHGDLVRSFSPQIELSRDSNDALALVEGFWSLYEVTGQQVYGDLAALSTRWSAPAKPLSGERYKTLEQAIAASPSGNLLKARPLDKPVTFQYIEAEEGRVVNRAIDTMEFQSSSGQPGKLAVMGRENTFWMRFDLPSEDDYLFDLSYLQSDVGGGLVSVMMRIDGDKIFQVPLGDVDGKPVLRRKYVDGPRPLRAGPHSFGIRFSGLLMTKPALLDSIVVQPALERRLFELPDGQYLYLLRNVTDKEARTDLDHFDSWPPVEQTVVDATGGAGKLGSSEDKRRRRKFVTVPPYGVALLKVKPSATKEGK